MKSLKEKIMKGIVKMAESTAKMDGAYWPPSCIGYIYQPKRPKNQEKTK
ncbi:MAG: cyclic lactone autoinducer peptide [Lachnospiraceae bacterium]